MFVIMSDDFQDDNGQTDGGALRKQLEAALKAKRDLESQNAELAKQVRSSSIKELFAAAKADPRGVKFYDGEPTKDALAEWLKGDGDVFAKAPEVKETQDQSQDGSAPVEFQGQLPPGVTPEQLQAALAASRMQPTPATTQGLGDLAEKVGRSPMKSEGDLQDLQKLWDGIRGASAALYQERGY